MTINSEVLARLVGGFLLLALGAWILHSFLGFLFWAVVLVLTTWPVYHRIAALFESQAGNAWVAVILTLLIATIILAPLGYGLNKLVVESQSLGKILLETQNTGLPAPLWLKSLPVVGEWASQQWNAALGKAEAARETMHWLNTGSVVAYTKGLASQILHRMFGLFITLLALFFLYQNGETLAAQIARRIQKMFGETGVRYADHAVKAIRATVNGLVLLGLCEGLFLGVGYAVSGLSHPAMLGAVTGVFAMVPFAAKIALTACSLVLAAEGQVAAGAGLFVFGFVVILVAENIVRPKLIGSSIKLPFLWTLLGIFGGLENFGLLGLFLGPTVMAVVISIWRDSQEEAV